MAKYQDTVETLITARNEALGELQRAEQQMKAQAAQERARYTEQQALAREQAQVEQQINDQRLRQAGQHLEADLAQIRQSYGERIQAADMANRKEYADRLTTLQQLEEAEARAAEKKRQEAAKGDGIGQLINAGLIVKAGMALGKVAEQLVKIRDEAQDARQAVAGLGEALGSALSPGFFRAGKSIGELIFGDEADARRITEQARAMEQQQQRMLDLIRESQEAGRESRQNARGIAEQRALLAAPEGRRERLKLEQDEAHAMSQIRDRLMAQQERDRKLNLQAESEATRVIRAELADRLRLRIETMAAFDREQQKSKASGALDDFFGGVESDVARDAARAKAAADADEELDRLRLQNAGNQLDIELHNIRTAAQARMDAARAASDEDLMGRLAVLQAEKEATARAQNERRRQIEDYREQQQELAEQEKELAERIARARRGAGDAPMTNADQNRFAAGLRQVQQQEDRAARSGQDKQLKAMEQQLKELQAARKGIDDLVKAIQAAPIVIAGGGQL